ncbi:peptidylprolyl isomerase [Brevundimonas sp.]|uniref:peptidylprolyl isomerase n=1 Tax=Brevundimonas sp. TaxID=1871086 RepID=UPI002ABA3729|nr:peptidylprolyl isomerase [Brevundimonas sp.]MDZ4363378.1 peptidylprolyl isomerase [Brevundimonas sp.]
MRIGAIVVALAVTAMAGAALAQAAPTTPPPTPAGLTAADWRTVAPENLLVIDTSKGRVLIELEPRVAPNHVVRIRTLADQGFYDGLKFHRVIGGFMAQTGDPLGTGLGSSDLPDIAVEAAFRRGRDSGFVPVANSGGTALRGLVGAVPVTTQPDAQMMITADMRVEGQTLFCPGVAGMARSNDPNSANSQFFLMMGENAALNGGYTVFGAILIGREVVQSLKRGSDAADGAVTVDPDIIVRARTAAAMPVNERPTVRVMDTRGPGFAALIESTRATRGNRFTICDIRLPAEVVN